MSFAEPSRIEPDDDNLVQIPLMILAFPLMVLMGLFIFLLVVLPVGLFAFLHNFTGELLFYLSMWNDGRTLSGRRLRQQLASGETGTLIIEYPTLGWGMNHAWWTPDNIPARAPVEGPGSATYDDEILDLMDQDLSHPWDAWCWQEYTSTWQGKASLLRVWNGKKYQKWLSRHYPSLPIVETTSILPREKEIEARQEPPPPLP